MLSVKEAIEVRRSIRHFRPDEVPDKLIEQMLEGARLAPSGSNIQPWRFLVIRDKEVKKELRRICLEQRFMEEAPVVIIDKTTIDYILPVLPKNSSKDRRSSSSAASTCTQGCGG